MAKNVITKDFFTRPLVAWYKENERDFPWRSDPSPYRVWVSEIMLQQTRIEAALPYFERFMEALPTVRDLAEAEEDLLLKLWEGLGYYSRVRNLQKAARQVMTDFGGKLPDRYEDLLTLAGVGEYTAGAIASIAFSKPVAAVDGNVLRVMARVLDEEGDVMKPSVRKKLSAVVSELVPDDEPSAFNQGIMELGETICLPNTMPHCDKCPVRSCCAVGGTERAAQLPTRALPKAKKTEKHTVLTIVTNEDTPCVLLHRRPPKGLLGGMWELPNVPTGECDLKQLFWDWGARLLSQKAAPKGKHVFSHIEWLLNGFVCITEPFSPPDDCVWVDKESLPHYALPTAFRLYAKALPNLLNTVEEDVI